MQKSKLLIFKCVVVVRCTTNYDMHKHILLAHSTGTLYTADDARWQVLLSRRPIWVARRRWLPEPKGQTTPDSWRAQFIRTAGGWALAGLFTSCRSGRDMVLEQAPKATLQLNLGDDPSFNTLLQAKKRILTRSTVRKPTHRALCSMSGFKQLRQKRPASVRERSAGASSARVRQASSRACL